MEYERLAWLALLAATWVAVIVGMYLVVGRKHDAALLARKSSPWLFGMLSMPPSKVATLRRWMRSTRWNERGGVSDRLRDRLHSRRRRR